MRNWPFHTMLHPGDGAIQQVAPGGWVAWDDHEEFPQAVIRAGWPDRDPGRLAFLKGGVVLRVTEAKTNAWLPRALRTALIHWRYRPRNLPPPQPQPPEKWRGS